jgi:hypothetical protein
MKRFILRFISASLLLFSTAIASTDLRDGNDNDFQPCEKTYVLPEQLTMSSEGIFVKFDGEQHQTQALFFDEGGIFILALSPNRDGCREGYVPCRNCSKCIREAYNICPLCNLPAQR